jgi:hypothetical protein
VGNLAEAPTTLQWSCSCDAVGVDANVVVVGFAIVVVNVLRCDVLHHLQSIIAI